MTSSWHGNTFKLIGPLWGESTSQKLELWWFSLLLSWTSCWINSWILHWVGACFIFNVKIWSYLCRQHHCYGDCKIGSDLYNGNSYTGSMSSLYWNLRETYFSLSCGTLSSVRLSEVIWQQRSGSALVHVIACCLTVPSHYLNQCWLLINKVLWHSPERNFIAVTRLLFCTMSFKIISINLLPQPQGPMS